MIWPDPGYFSISVTYYDINDFYWSGHIGGSVLAILEWKALGWYKMMLTAVFVCINECLLMNLTNGHYIIDIVTGVLIARVFISAGEWSSYFYDVKLIGLPKKKRESYYYKPCSKCGWSNHKPSFYAY